MISLQEAQLRLLAMVRPLASRECPLGEAVNGYAAAPVLARRDQPASDLSAMDGYAIRNADFPGPWVVVGESAAGTPFSSLVGQGQAVRISTGAVLPDGADMVLIQENCTRQDKRLVLSASDANLDARHVRTCGQDFQEGQAVIATGDAISPARIALAAMAGHDRLAVRRQPRIMILNTGDELVPPGADVPFGKIPASNGVMLEALLRPFPCSIARSPIIPDRLDSICEAIAAAEADVIVTSGGASVGDHDLIRPALERLGAKPDFWKVAIKPGKPILAAQLGKTVILGLPGNPVSAFVTATLFLLPLVRRLAGASDPLPITASARAACPIRGNGSRAEFLRARVIDGAIAPLDQQGSAAMVALSQANALLIRAVDAPPVKSGEIVEYLPI